jgi:outer membrane protein assembly factor BamE (lipoprotein component of BamABCDE complex)
MNQTKTAKRLLTILIAAAAMSLTACGGGSDSNDIGSVLPKGTVRTTGDGINQSEYDAVVCGMSREQVQAIIGDTPTAVVSENLWSYTYPSYYGQMAFGGSGLTFKMIGQNNKAVQVNQC